MSLVKGWIVMALHNSIKDLNHEIIEEYLATVKICLAHTKSDGGILGYSATLLLLCITDAIGHGILGSNGNNTRLDVLKHPPFLTGLTDNQVKNLKDWFRNKLAHSAALCPGVHLRTDTEGPPFDFEGEKLVGIRVPVFHGIVEKAWRELGGALSRVPVMPPPQVWPKGGTDRQSTLSPACSGSALPDQE